MARDNPPPLTPLQQRQCEFIVASQTLQRQLMQGAMASLAFPASAHLFHLLSRTPSTDESNYIGLIAVGILYCSIRIYHEALPREITLQETQRYCQLSPEQTPRGVKLHTWALLVYNLSFFMMAPLVMLGSTILVKAAKREGIANRVFTLLPYPPIGLLIYSIVNTAIIFRDLNKVDETPATTHRMSRHSHGD